MTKTPFAALASLLILTSSCTSRPEPPADTPSQQAATTPADTTDTLALDSVSHDYYYAVPDRGQTYIDSVFRAHMGPAPRMGWFRGATFLASERHPRLVLYSADATLGHAEFQRVMGPGEHREMTRADALACDTPGPLGEYRVAAAVERPNPRAFYTSQAPPVPLVVGLQLLPSSQADIQAGRALLALGPRPIAHRDTMVSVAPGRSYYSLHAAYDSAARTLLKAALMLHDSTGRVVGSHLQDSTSFDCDACEVPTWEDGISRLYDFINGFQFSFLPYPVLMLDTSTFEGRALSLVTFTQDGRHVEYRTYEYVVNCVRSRREP